jgi:hypothetical protein
MIKLEPLLISAGLRLAICLSPLSTLQPCICLGEVDCRGVEVRVDLAEEGDLQRYGGDARCIQALYPETENKQHEDIQNIEVHRRECILETVLAHALNEHFAIPFSECVRDFHSEKLRLMLTCGNGEPN